MSKGYAGFFVLILVIPAAILYYIYQRKQWFQRNGFFASGIIVRLVTDENDDEPVALYPVVRFLTSQRGWIEARYDAGQYPAAYHVGQTVELLYDPADPKKFIIGAEPFGIADWWPYAVILAVIAYGMYMNI
ncbi:hypothetical protein HNQ93_003785 [Hymenobacter luteus]|uniref:DUF3592 domain-containing protein n=2 Tax=Hymenobacter TaxID=89966 RepID=A0A7W9WCI0_9BACT|nr:MULTISPECIES: DUF3592 domain-containing protein [Hymenobacter]MBB4603132.1 hypothetical protein [Hymenobacter latericoloratus]MBB6060909.1 hypothetical protein [Hymenobacter luteus]